MISAQPGRPVHRLPEICGARTEGIGEVVADDRGNAARPEEQPDQHAHCAADRHVLDSHNADLPPDRCEQVEEQRDGHRERRLADRERESARRVGGDEHGDRKHRPQRP